ncbi:hypothetical protein HHK36_028268 [Tetracentron sinense]|uniref:PWWP domain-containing protein n=1 Tax=Tetracentron sinense TaxID=13715 RepID=A0A834YGB0_TETSI|nr:hypothetical protein HHK36_028268 [Tetracentron sinense]
MGISDGLQGSGGVDCSVGTIVWVRRRNGSWWPGRILGSNEVSASHLMSPRSGTPVQLLGREDASVDWYNLEKSKRVKAFRCGEFDDCIERAESSQGIPIKKREKYARREDAILHALELEKQQVDRKQQKLGIASNCAHSKMPGFVKELGTYSESLENDHGKLENIVLHPFSKGLDLSLEEESMGNPLHAQKVKQGKQLSWEDDNAEVIPRMRGLQDFGLRIAPSKRKLSSSFDLEGSRRPSVGKHAEVIPSGCRSMGGVNHVNSNRNTLAKRKRSQEGLTEVSLVKRRDRRRPLVQVLQSSAKLPVSHSLQSDGDAVSISMPGEMEQAGVTFRAKRSKCVYVPAELDDGLDHTECPLDQVQMAPSQFGLDNSRLHPGSLMEENTSSGLIEDAESDSSERDYLDPDIDEETTVLSDATMLTAAEPRNSDRYGVQGQLGSMSNEELDESTLTGYISNLHAHDKTAAAAADVGISKWQLKGKRNIRNISKRPVEVIDVKGPNGSIHGTYLEQKGNNLSQRALGQGFYHKSEEFNYGYDSLIEKDFQTQMIGFDNRRYPLKAASKDYSRISTDVIDSGEDSVWEADELSQSALRGYWEDPGESFDPVYAGYHVGNRSKSMLVDVDLKVQASYQGERVPLVSLMSRLNGKAIIGHPIQIEALEDGSSDILLSTNGDFGDEVADNDGSTAVPPVWRTARRTAMHRVPRPHPSSALEGDEGSDHPQLDHENKPPSREPYTRHLDLKARLIRNNFPHIRRPPTDKKFPRKLLKKVSLSSQKTRMLSSIAIEQKLSGKSGEQELGSKSYIGRLIKTEEATVTCIPVKLVFSRLLEAVGRPPSRASSSHGGVLINGHTEREPSQAAL